MITRLLKNMSLTGTANTVLALAFATGLGLPLDAAVVSIDFATAQGADGVLTYIDNPFVKNPARDSFFAQIVSPQFGNGTVSVTNDFTTYDLKTGFPVSGSGAVAMFSFPAGVFMGTVTTQISGPNTATVTYKIATGTGAFAGATGTLVETATFTSTGNYGSTPTVPATVSLTSKGGTLTVVAAPAAASTANSYFTTNLVSNVAGAAAVTDSNLVDPWGISSSTAGSPFWVSNHLAGNSTLYNGSGVITPTVVAVPAGAGSGKVAGRPTGQVWNGTATAFLLPKPGNGSAASFIFATEDGTISGWNGGSGSLAQVMVDNSISSTGAILTQKVDSAVYKGLAIGNSAAGATLYAANFRSGNIDVFDSKYNPLKLSGTFSDPAVPAGFAPFNIWTLGGQLYVAYAKQDAAKYLDVAGAGNGYVAAFDLNGKLVAHIASGGALNSPWGLAIAPANWGAFGGALLVGNFGDGKINAYDLKTNKYLGAMQDASGATISISGLWGLLFGNGGRGGDSNTLYFTAGVPNGSKVARGLLGALAPPAALSQVLNAASLMPGPIAPGEIVTIQGSSVGPSPAIAATIPKTGSVPTTLAGTTVMVNGTAAPIISTGSTATTFQVPYEVGTSSSASIVLSFGGQTTAALTVPVGPSAPGLVTSNGSGLGQLLAMNSDGSVNSAKNPARLGQPLSIFTTGAGQTTPASKTGAIQETTAVSVSMPVWVYIGGLPANFVTTSGVAGSLTDNVSIQCIIPNEIVPGQTSVSITVGSGNSQYSGFIYTKY